MLNRSVKLEQIKKHLVEYYAIEDTKVLDRLGYIEAINLPPQHQKSFDFLNNERLAGTMIVVVPDDLWFKGEQPSESNAEGDVILFKQSYFESADNIAWMTHELAHCQKYKNAPEQYEQDSQTYAFQDIVGEYAYPNNIVERYTFTKQFEFLKQEGLSREEIFEMIKKEYEESDLPFFERLLDEIF